MAGIDSFTKLCLHCNGVDGSQTFVDNSAGAHAVSAIANAQVDTVEKKFGSGSALFDGTGDYLEVPDSPDWDYVNGDFTLDFWVNLHSKTGGDLNNWPGFISQNEAGTHSVRFAMYPTDILYFYVVNNSTILWYFQTPFNATLDTWYHVAVVRSGSTPYIFIDGVSQSLTINTPLSETPMPALAAPLQIGGAVMGVDKYLVNGWMDEVRVSKGVARWTSNFTPPTTEYTAGPVSFNPTPTKGVMSDATASLGDVISFMSGDAYFDSTNQFGRVDVFYTHQDGREKKRVSMKRKSPGVLTGGVQWSDWAHDGTWSATRLVAYDRDGAKHVSDSTNLSTESSVVI